MAGGGSAKDKASGAKDKATDSPAGPAKRRVHSASPPRRPAEANAAGGDKAAKGKAEQRQAAEKKASKTSWFSVGSNVVVALIFLYAGVVGNSFRSILWPKFPDVDPKTHKFLPKHNNVFREGDTLNAQLWVGLTPFPDATPLAEFEFQYQWDGYKTVSRKVNASISQAQLQRNQNLHLSAVVTHRESGNIVRAVGGLVKSISPPEAMAKYRLLSREVCPVDPEPAFGKKGHIGKGIPKMEVRLVFDNTAYPAPWARGPYTPPVFVDEFWMTNDQLVTLNMTGDNSWESEVHFNLMGIARWRFQRHMEASFQQTAKMFGEDSEEMLQMRDLFANTHPYLLAATIVVSMLEVLFQFLAFKNDVEFFQGVDVETLNKYVSVNSIIAGIVMQIFLTMYLWDESANFLVLASSVVGILVDVWKVFRAMRLEWRRFLGFLPYPVLVSKVKREKTEDFDSLAMKWLTAITLPFIIGYAVYSLVYDCHKGWYSYFLFVSASCVYSLGFVLMTPQLFINYKHKTVAYLPWKKFVYRALTTFIDDLFAMIVRMPTMHRLSCFRDDVVFLIYLYQRQIYSVDRTRVFDEDGYELSAEEVAALGDNGGAAKSGQATEPKKNR